MGEIDMMEQQTPTLVFGEVEDAVKDMYFGRDSSGEGG